MDDRDGRESEPRTGRTQDAKDAACKESPADAFDAGRADRKRGSGSKRGRNPEFLCMGFQKCGTTSLFEILRRHKDVVLCRDVKEPMYYRVSGLWFFGRRWYYQHRYYGHIAADDTRRCGEVNAGLTFTGCAKKICHDFSPDTKLIFMMRNPVDRAYSSYKYFLARGFLEKGLVEEDQKYGHAEAFDRYVHSVLDNPASERQIMKKRLKYLVFSQSCYATCIREYLGHFPQENIKLVFFEEFVKDEKAACKEIFAFIGVGEDEALSGSVRANEGNERVISSQAAKKQQILKGFYYGFYEFVMLPHWLPGAYQKFKAYYDRQRDEAIVPDEDKSKVLPKTRTFLETYFAKEVRGIEQISGRDLSELWYSSGKYLGQGEPSKDLKSQYA
ncbi:MAG: sulfotransferase domain-containing protein [Lachnospiraceae bacterium]|nr:sulfotransferase domain-containing protein [Lachnospiraceae bacterium]